MGSVIMVVFPLPARLHESRDFSRERELAETQSAEAKFAQKSPWPAAAAAAVHLTNLELRLSAGFCDG
jgi:hypothetical protein